MVEVTADGDHNAFGGITKAANGDLLVVYRKSTEHNPPPAGTYGVLKTKRSTDNGATWGSEVLIHTADEPDFEARDCCLSTLSDGRIAVSWFDYQVATEDHMDSTSWVMFSANHGVTWGTPIQVDAGMAGQGVFGGVAELANGDLMVAIYGVVGADTKRSTKVIHSTDDGATWSELATVAAGGTTRDYEEPYLLRLDNNDLMVMMRGSDSGAYWMSKSDDDGVTWSAPVNAFAGQGSRPALCQATNGAIICTFRDNLHDGAARTSWNRGTNWEAQTVFDQGSRFAYGQMVEVFPNLIGSFWSMEEDATPANAEAKFAYFYPRELADPIRIYTITADEGEDADDQTATIQAQLDDIPDGTDEFWLTVQMAPGTYRVDDAVTLTGLRYATLDFSGVTFSATVDGVPFNTRRHFTVDGCDHVTISGLTISGSSPVAGTGDSAYDATKEFQHGFRIYNGSSDIELDGCNVYDIWGDFVYIGAGLNTAITVHDGDFRRNGRQGFAVVEGTDIEFADNVLSDIRRSFVDVEPNGAAQEIHDVRVLRNSLVMGNNDWPAEATPHRLSFFANLGAASPISNIYFEDNESEGRLSAFTSGTSGQHRTNLVFARNTFTTQYGSPTNGGIFAEYWDGITLTDNVVPLQDRSPAMVLCLWVTCTGLVDGGGNVITPGGVSVFDEYP